MTITEQLSSNATVQQANVHVILESVATIVTRAIEDLKERHLIAQRAASASTTGISF